MGWMAGLQFLAGPRDFSLLYSTHTSLGAYPASCSVRTRSYFPGAMWPRYEAAYLSPSTAKVKNDEAIPPLPILLNGVVLN
jgi:hypothetical protein